MRCAYHPNKEATTQCSLCKKPLCDECALPDGEKSIICNRCVTLKAAQDAVQDIDQRMDEKETRIKLDEFKKKRQSRIWLAFQWFILVVCTCIIIMQFPKLISAFKAEKPIRSGTYSTDAGTDQCISNLWHISGLMQQGKLPGKDIVCPKSKMPYVVTSTAGDIIVRCANPKLHGFREIRVSKKNIRPEIIK